MAMVDPALLPEAPPAPRGVAAPGSAVADAAVADADLERDLVDRARQPSRDGADAFAELYRRYLPRVHAFAYRRCGSRERAEDVTAATFEQALRALGSFQWRSGGFAPWLFAIAANELVDHHRADQRNSGRRDARAAGAAVLLAGVADDRVSWGEGPELDVPPDQLRLALATLHPRYQRAVSLRYLSGLSHAESAEAMGCTKPVMAVTLHRALKALRRALEDAPTVTSGGTPVPPSRRPGR